MFAPDTDYDPIPVATGQLLAEIGIDLNAVRETVADDRVRRCPDREVLADGRRAEGGLPDAGPTRWSERRA
ncbi:MAG: hypothetical protein F4222_10985 [Gammaproteobacteria bacterium]|nr:hypothetical protein [Gammaproteobacteria bacterium]MYF59575.1 hypothetical protein [Gammaproteobacteria bacterium]